MGGAVPTSLHMISYVLPGTPHLVRVRIRVRVGVRARARARARVRVSVRGRVRKHAAPAGAALVDRVPVLLIEAERARVRLG